MVGNKTSAFGPQNQAYTHVKSCCLYGVMCCLSIYCQTAPLSLLMCIAISWTMCMHLSSWNAQQWSVARMSSYSKMEWDLTQQWWPMTRSGIWPWICCHTQPIPWTLPQVTTTFSGRCSISWTDITSLLKMMLTEHLLTSLHPSHHISRVVSNSCPGNGSKLWQLMTTTFWTDMCLCILWVAFFFSLAGITSFPKQYIVFLTTFRSKNLLFSFWLHLCFHFDPTFGQSWPLCH